MPIKPYNILSVEMHRTRIFNSLAKQRWQTPPELKKALESSNFEREIIELKDDRTNHYHSSSNYYPDGLTLEDIERLEKL
jgi:hypothetical protein